MHPPTADLSSAGGILALVLIVLLEAVMAVDNVLVISIQTDQLPENQKVILRRIGIFTGGLVRLVLLYFVTWLKTLEVPFATILGLELSVSKLIMLGGGGLLGALAIHHFLEEFDKEHSVERTQYSNWTKVFPQILIINVVFSIDSVLSAVGMTDSYWIMATAVILSVIVMILLVQPIHKFMTEYPAFKMLGLGFVGLIGFVLFAEGLGYHIGKEAVYTSLIFAIIVVSMISLQNRFAGKSKKS